MIRAKAVVNFVLNRRMGQEWRRNIIALNPECLVYRHYPFPSTHTRKPDHGFINMALVYPGPPI
jgi:hypothetical protein